LFAGGVPLTAEQAAGLVRGLTPEQFRQAIDALNRDYRRQGRPYLIQPGPAGFVLTVRHRFRRVREKLFGAPREARLSQPALDVLAAVAYRQPVTRADVETFRGTESGSVLRQLIRLGLIAGVSDPARPSETAYGTTARFLELFGLTSLDDLPRTGDLQKL
jgi:segregation and condensation protein B